jgi:predicted MPP superfamily phosphohydrolase
VTLHAPELEQATRKSEVYDFHTPPERGRPLRFVIYGDVRSGHDVHVDLVRAIRQEGADLAIMTGDLVDMGSDEADWTRYFSIATPLLARLPVYPAPGNHEYARAGRGAVRFRALFQPGNDAGPGWRSFEVAGVHFIALDSSNYHSPEQLAWLKKDLEHARNARAIFAYAHEGAYSSGLHGDNEIAKTQYAPLLERAGVTLFVSGHDHHYERGRVGKLDYVVSGGGGAELRSQRCGVPGRKPCPPRMLAFANEHHYIVVDVLPGLMRMCPKRTDGTAIEPCVTRAISTR